MIKIRNYCKPNWYCADGERREQCKNLDKYANMEVTDKPFYTDLRIRGSETNHCCIPVIGIWMHDYDLSRK